MANGYPAWRYHASEAPKRILSAAEEADGWVDSPKKATAPAPQVASEPARRIRIKKEIA